MTGKTPTWQIPYPTETDDVSQTPNTFKLMAERIDQILTQINQGRNITNGQD